MQRRVFLIEAGKSFPVVAGALYLVRCKGSATGASDVSAIVATSTVVDGHSHQCTVPAADMLHPLDASYDTTTTAGHRHSVMLSLAQLTTLAAGGAVNVSTTTDAGHRHEFTFQQR